MTYGDMILYRLEQACLCLDTISNMIQKEVDSSRIDGNKIKELSLLVKQSKALDLSLKYRNEELELLNLRHNVNTSATPEALRENLEKYSSYLRELNSKYSIFVEEEGIKMIL